MTYTEFILEHIKQKRTGEPIYSADLAKELAAAFGLNNSGANAAVSVAMKRIIDRKTIAELRCYQKGIYYLAVETPFGETGIDKEAIIQRKYLAHDIGYETGLSALYRLGLTTQLPRERTIATNRAGDCQRKDKDLDVVVRPPKVEITADNKRYLQALDVVDLIDRAPIDTADPYKLLARFMSRYKLNYHQLLALADRYYNKKTVLNLAHIAAAEGTEP